MKGKGKATAPKLAKDEDVSQMSKSRIEAEIKDLEELREDLALKVCALRSLMIIPTKLSLRWKS